MLVSIILFAVAALGGAFLGVTRVRDNKNPPMAIALVHGAVAAAALVTLVIYVIGANYPTLPTLSAAVFILAALGGFIALSSHVRGKLIGTSLVAVHALAAIAGFVLLVASAVLP